MPTTFNFLGPLANPARVRRQAVGVSRRDDGRRGCSARSRALGTERAMVFYGDDGLDELTTTTTRTVHELRDGATTSRDVDPASFGVPTADRTALAGGDAAANAQIVHRGARGRARARSATSRC